VKRIRRGEKRKREFDARTRDRRDFQAREEAVEWVPKTDIGRRVKNKEITTIEQIFELGKPVIEHQIVDILLPNLRDEVIKVSMTQRMTDCGRKSQFRAVVIVGDGVDHLGIGAGKADETKPAIETAIKNAKRHVIHVPLGCGSWECGCGQRHTLPIVSTGKSGSVTITLKPAPRGVGIAANEIVRKVLGMAGVKDIWSFSRGRTRGVYNTAMAVFNALDNLNKMKYKGDWETTADALSMQKPAQFSQSEKAGGKIAETQTTTPNSPTDSPTATQPADANATAQTPTPTATAPTTTTTSNAPTTTTTSNAPTQTTTPDTHAQTPTTTKKEHVHAHDTRVDSS